MDLVDRMDLVELMNLVDLINIGQCGPDRPQGPGRL